MSMMEVGIVGVAVAQGSVAVPVRMRLFHRAPIMVVMMLIVRVEVVMLNRVMGMLVPMPLPKM